MQWVKETGQLSSRIKLTGHNKLEIESFEDQDVGVYSCILTDSQAKTQIVNKISVVIKSVQIEHFSISILDALSTPRLAIKHRRSIYELNRNKKLDLECISDATNTNMGWSKLLNSYSETSQTIDESYLSIYPIEEEDVGDYVCSAKNGMGLSKIVFRLDKDLSSGEYEFYIKSLSSKPNEKFNEHYFDYNSNEDTVSYSKSSRDINNRSAELVIAKLYQPVLIKCPHKHSISSNVKWFRSGIRLPGSLVNHFGDVFINKVNLSDFGIYTCRVNKKNYQVNLEKSGMNFLSVISSWV